MHSASDWLGYAVWQDGVLLRSLSLSPNGGITEDIGAPLTFEASFWVGEHTLGNCRGTTARWFRHESVRPALCAGFPAPGNLRLPFVRPSSRHARRTG